MPTYIDGIADPPELFYCDGDGNYVPFTTIQTVAIKNEIENDTKSVIPNFTDTGELSFSLTLTPKSSRKLRKALHKLSNKIKRTVRTSKRRQEKERRHRLKHENT